VSEPLLESRGITKSFGGVRALRGADFAVHPGEVAALVGDNGAGKSTLVKILSGTLAPDGGEIWFEGRQVTIPTPVAARELGIETVYQDLALAPELDPAANLFLGRELVRPGLLGRLGFLDKAAMRRRTNKAFADLGIGLQDTGAMVANLSGGQRQSVAVSRAATWVSKVVFMDEPTAALRGGPVGPRARPDPPGPRLGDHGRAHQPQPAGGDGAGRPHRGAPARGPGGPLPHRRHHHGAGHRGHDRRPGARGGGLSE
jgi:simple sugar transport system ATP-binding protein